MRLVELEVMLDAPPVEVYRYLTTQEGLVQWMAVAANAEPVPGGKLEWTHENGATMIGSFIELDPPRRLVMAYGWKDNLMGVPPGSTIVEIELSEEGTQTRLTLTHRGLPAETMEEHRFGWDVFTRRLEAVLNDQPSGHHRPESPR